MKVSIITANTLSNASKQLFKDINNTIDEKNIIIVPDKFSLTCEKQALQAIGKKSSFNIEVLTLSRFANRYTVSDKKVLSKFESIMLIKKCITETKDKLSCFEKSANATNFAENIFQTITKFKFCNISSDNIIDDKIISKNLKLKLEDIKIIYSAYEKYFVAYYDDSFNLLTNFSKIIEKNEEFKNINLYFAYFNEFTPKVLSVIAEMIKQFKSVNFALQVAEKKQVNAHIYPNDTFDQIGQVLKLLSVTPVVKNIITEETTQSFLQKNLYSFSKEIKVQNHNLPTIFESKDINDEVEFIGSQIKKEIIENGLRYNQISIACADINSYAKIFEKIFKKYNIPFFIDIPSNLSTTSIAKLVLDAIQINKNDYELVDIINFTKNQIFDLDTYKVNIFNNYLRKYSCSKNISNDFDAGKEKPEILETVNEIRKNFIELYLPLKELSSCNNAKEYCNVLTNYLESEVIKNGLTNLISLLRKSGKIKEAKIYSNSLDKLISLINSISNILSEMKLSINEFYEIIKTGIESANFPLLPLSVDCVFIGNAYNSVFETNEVLFACGLSENTFPNVSQDVGIISDDELSNLNKYMFLSPSVRLMNKRARLKCVDLVTNYKSRLILSYSLLSLSGETQKLSDIVNQIKSKIRYMFEDKTYELQTISYDHILSVSNISNKKGVNKNIIYSFVNEQVASEKMLNVMQNYYSFVSDDNIEAYSSIYSYCQNKSDLFNECLKPTIKNTCDTANKLLFKDNNTKISMIESYFSCPFKNFMDNGLQLHKFENGKVQKSDIGNILHKVAEKYLKNRLKNNTEDECRELAKEYFISSINELHLDWLVLNPDNELLIEDLREESFRLVIALNYTVEKSTFIPTYFEAGFGTRNKQFDSIKMKVDDKTLNLRGVIDRIDIHSNNFRIIDYKTGSTDFCLEDLYCGKKVQLFVYQDAIMKSTNMTPSGVYYMPIKNSFDKDSGSSSSTYKLNGASTNDIKLALATDCDLSNEHKVSSIANISVKIDKDTGEMIVNDTKPIFSKDDLIFLSDYALKVSKQSLKEMLENNIMPSPMAKGRNSTCQYCPYNSICKFDKTISKMRELNQSVTLSDKKETDK